jgi:hypothetical protein
MMPTMRTENSPSRGQADRSRREAVQARDAGVRLAARLNRWVVAAAVALASALTALTAHGYHARAATTRTSAARTGEQSTGTSATASQGTPAPATGATVPAPAPQPPASAPVPAPAAVAPVVSGGS